MMSNEKRVKRAEKEENNTLRPFLSASTSRLSVNARFIMKSTSWGNRRFNLQHELIQKTVGLASQRRNGEQGCPKTNENRLAKRWACPG